MNKLIAALIVSTFAIGAYAQNAATTPAAPAAKEAKAETPKKATAKKHTKHHVKAKKAAAAS